MAGDQLRASRFRFSITTWLLLVTLAALLPMLAYLAISTARLLADQRAASEAALERRAAVAAAAVQREIAGFIAQVEVLGLSPAFEGDQFAAAHRYAQRVVAADPLIVSISLADADGRQLFNSLVPYGQALPVSAAPKLPSALLAPGESLVSPMLKGAVSGEPLAGVAVSLQRADGSAQFLRLAFRVAGFDRVLAEQRWPADWTGAVVDQNGIIVARSREPTRFTGTPITPSVTAALREGRRDIFESITKDGVTVVTSAAPVGRTGWHVVVGQSKASLDQQARQAVLQPAAVGMLCLLLAIGASSWLARRIGAEVRGLALNGVAGERSTASVREVTVIQAELGRVRDEAERQTQALHGARHDALTGLAGRALFTEQLQDKRRLAAAAGADLALMFIDLDGFKAINDRQGHAAGDRILAQVGRSLQEQTRQLDLIGRLGGDEFVVTVDAAPGQVGAVVDEVAGRVIAAVGQLAPGLGCSIGVAVARSDEALDALIARADGAMYAAKQAGKGQVVWSS